MINKTFSIGSYRVHVIFHLDIFRAGITIEQIETCRLKCFPDVSANIGRIKAVRQLTGCSIKDAKEYVDLKFGDTE